MDKERGGRAGFGESGGGKRMEMLFLSVNGEQPVLFAIVRSHSSTWHVNRRHEPVSVFAETNMFSPSSTSSQDKIHIKRTSCCMSMSVIDRKFILEDAR